MRKFETIRHAYNNFFFETDTMGADQVRWLIDLHRRGLITINELLTEYPQLTN